MQQVCGICSIILIRGCANSAIVLVTFVVFHFTQEVERTPISGFNGEMEKLLELTWIEPGIQDIDGVMLDACCNTVVFVRCFQQLWCLRSLSMQRFQFLNVVSLDGKHL